MIDDAVLIALYGNRPWSHQVFQSIHNLIIKLQLLGIFIDNLLYFIGEKESIKTSHLETYWKTQTLMKYYKLPMKVSVMLKYFLSNNP